MQQLPLDIRLADYALFSTFVAGPNDACAHALRALAGESGHALVWLWGAAGSGRTHLLQACVNEAAANDARVAFLPLRAEHGLRPEAVAGIEVCDVVCVDDVDTVAGDAEWERALLLLFEGVVQRGGRMACAAGNAPAAAGFSLRDLASRFASGATFRLRELSDDDRIDALRLRAKWRGLELDDGTARYLLSRVERDAASLFALLDRLDREALVAQRRLTVPFVRDVLRRPDA
jgi:DnaA family protein